MTKCVAEKEKLKKEKSESALFSFQFKPHSSKGSVNKKSHKPVAPK